MSIKKNILPIFIPFLGCVNKCIFCNQEAITDTKLTLNIISDINKQYDSYAALKIEFDEIAFYGGNFGALDKELRHALYSFADEKNFSKLRYSTRVDTITDELLAEAKRYGVTFIELGVQSLDDKVLKSNLRPYSRDDIFSAVKKVSSEVDCGVQMMVGMYEQELLSPIDDAKQLASLDIKTVRIYPTVVIKNTALELLYNKGEYGVIDFVDAVIVSAVSYLIYEANGIKVIRLSLPDDINSGDNIVAGLYHESYGDIVRSFIIMLYLDLGYKLTGRKTDVYKYAGYKAVVRENYLDSFTEEDLDVITFDEIVKKVYEGYGRFEDSSRAFKGKAAHIAKKYRYQTDDR